MLKVMIADDEPIVLEGLRWLVDWDKLGFELVGEAYDGEDALKLMEQCRPDLVITDIRMPVIDGLALIEQASGQFPLTQFIILSGYADFDYARRALRHGVSNYLTKPLDDTELENAVKAAAHNIRLKEAKLRNQQAANKQVREETVVRLLLGETSEEWVSSARMHFHMNEDSRIRCVLLDRQDGKAQAARMGLEGIERAAHDSAWTGVAVIPFRISKDYQGFLLVSSPEGPDLSMELVNRIIDSLRTCWEKPVFTVSAEHCGALSLNKAYQEAATAGIGKTPPEENGIYYYQDRLMKDAPLLPEELKSSILKALAEGNPEGVQQFSKAYFTAISANQAPESWVEAYLSTVKLEALKVLIEHGADEAEWSKKWFEPARQCNPGGLKCRWIKDLMDAAEWVAAGKGSRPDEAVYAAVEYIKLHYQNKLLLQHVADRLYLNPAYLGQRFKKQLGIPFNEYLHSVRIEEAKKLLRRTDLKITDIATRVGYPYTDQFVAKFKAVTGMLPSAYKKGC